MPGHTSLQASGDTIPGFVSENSLSSNAVQNVAIGDIGQTQIGKSLSLNAEVNGNSNAYSYAWNFGDGSTATGSAVSHTYTAVGNYTLSLSVSGTNGSRRIVKSISVVRQTTVYPNPYAAFPSNGDPPSNPQVILPVIESSPGNGSTTQTIPVSLSPATSIPVGWLIGLGLLIVLIAIGAMFFVFRKKPGV